MNPIHVRRVETVDDLITAGLARLIPQVSSSAPAVDALLLQNLVDAASTCIFVAEQSGEVVGTASLVVLDTLSGRKGHIDDVAVDSSARRAGVGTMLLHAVIAHARTLGLRHVELTSRPSREAANAFYRSFGFQRRDTNVYRFSFG